MYGDQHQPPPGLPGMNAANPVAVEDADYATLQAYADMTAATARYAQLLVASRQQHAGQMNAMQFAAGEASPSPSPKLSAAKGARFTATLRTLLVCIAIGAAGGFYARGQLLPQQQPSQQLSRQ